MNEKSIFLESNLAFCLLLPCFLLYPHLPQWASFSAIIFWFYRFIIEKMEWKIPSRFVTGMFSLIFLGITYFTFDTLIGRDSTCSFLIVLLSLKILEYRSSEENTFLILLGFYLISSKFLYETDFVWFSIGFPTMIVLIYYLLPSYFRKRNSRLAGLFVIKSLLLSFPLSLFLFFYFPRFSSEMFSIKNQDDKLQNVGFTEEIEPGSVSSLIQNDELVFRSEFQGIKPTINNLYWRGLTLTKQDGLKWSRDPNIELNSKLSLPVSLSNPYVKVTLEPNYFQWIYSLDQTTNINSDQIEIAKLPLGIFKSMQSIDSRIVYNLEYINSPLREKEISELQIIINESPSNKLKQFLKIISANTKSPEDVIEKISDYYIKNQFKYTLTPGDQGNLTIDRFLFETKKGFCEHYAGTTALLLNLLKIPARVIAGYHGGEFNPIGKFWSIRQRDAHAWIEYLNSENKWRRYDPTAVIAPMRLALGSTDFTKMMNTDAKSQFQNLLTQISSNSKFEQFTFLLENLNYKWSSIVVNFDIEKQKKLLKEMNISLTESILYGMLLTVIMAISLSWLLRNTTPLSRSKKIYNLINQHFEKYGLDRKPTEGPETWKNRTLEAFPDKANKINALFSCYIAETYENNQSNSNITRVKQLLRFL